MENHNFFWLNQRFRLGHVQRQTVRLPGRVDGTWIKYRLVFFTLCFGSHGPFIDDVPEFYVELGGFNGE